MNAKILDAHHELFSNENKKVVGKFKVETSKNIWIDEFIALRSEAHSFMCNDENTIKLKCFSKSQSRDKTFDECYMFFLEESLKKIVIFILLDPSVMKCIFKEFKIYTISI